MSHAYPKLGPLGPKLTFIGFNLPTKRDHTHSRRGMYSPSVRLGVSSPFPPNTQYSPSLSLSLHFSWSIQTNKPKKKTTHNRGNQKKNS